LTKKVLIFHNIASSYYKNCVFQAFYELYHDVKVVHLAETRGIRSWKFDRSELGYPNEMLFPGNLDRVPRFLMVKAVLNILRSEKPDIVYVGGYSYLSYWVALVWSKLNGKVFISEIDSNRFDHVRSGWKEAIKKVFARSCDVVVTYGKTSKEYVRDLGVAEDKIVIKPNVTTTKHFDSSPRELPELLKSKNNLLYVGRLSFEKNIELLLRAYSAAKKETNDNRYSLIIIGDGPEETRLRALVTSECIPDVVFIGFVEKQDLAKYYVNSTVFILPSTSEPWGLVVNEAMMCGLPVIVSTHCGCSQDLVNNNGYTFEPDDLDVLKRILVSYILNKENIELQRQQSLSIIESYTPENVAQVLSGLMVKFK